MRRSLVKFGLEALMGFTLYTIAFTPYLFLVTRINVEQYITWLIMQICYVPPVCVIVVNITNKVVKRVLG